MEDSHAEPPQVVPIGTLTEEEFMRHVLDTNDKCKEHINKMIDGYVRLRAHRAQEEALLSEITGHQTEASKLASAVGHSIRNRLLAGDAVQKLEEAGIPLPKSNPVLASVSKVGAFLFAALFLNMHGIRASNQSEPPMITTVPAETMEWMRRGRESLAFHDWQLSYDAFSAAYKTGTADNVECLLGMAECQLRLKQYDVAMSHLDSLDIEFGGKLHLPAVRLRGCIEESRGNVEAAKLQYHIAENNGDKEAGILHRRLQ